MRKIPFLVVVSALISACGGSTNETPAESNEAQAMYVPEHEKGLLEKATRFFTALPSRAESTENPLTDEKIALGKTLYLDTRLSKDGNNSCNSCHGLETYGVDNKQFSEGDLGKNGDRNSPSVYNAALHFAQFWDGRAADVEEQAGMPILNPVEMNIPSEKFLVDRLKGIDTYKEMFKSAFPDDSDPVTYKNLRYAIAAFERTLITPSAFDDYLNGDENALDKDQKKGLYDFIEVGCITCHTGAGVGGNMFQKFGLYGDYWELTGSKVIDEGRFKVSGNEAEKYVFKAPSLRNIEMTSPYLHDGSVSDLSKVIRIMGKLQLNKDLSDEQVKSVLAFLKSLTGEIPSGANS
ncbi:MAG TPA: cytochrome-c peroxidase [Flavobacteriales bacterium]|nr:cytochrome-c peroxidase [Flavobacteriales bacterium]